MQKDIKVCAGSAAARAERRRRVDVCRRELAMPAYDLAQWDISVMNRSLLAPKSYNEFFASVKLKDGSDTHYALGLDVRDLQGHAELEHTGEV